jgi:hypothetical protein
MKFAVSRADMRLALVEDLQAPLRSPVDGKLVSDDLCCSWYLRVLC